MSVYSIDYSEPLKLGFEIPAGGFNGPGATGGSSNTSLRLHGRGALEWGEAVNEDLVRLTENFASASPPINALSGQLWAELKLYHYTGTPGQFRRWNINTQAWDVASIVAVDGTNPVNIPAAPVSGTNSGYYYTIVGGVTTLYGYYPIATVREPVYGWRTRSFSSGVLPTIPEQTIKVFNANGSQWTAPQSVTVSATSGEPTTPAPGTLWYNTTTSTLNVWDPTLNAGLGAWSALITAGIAYTGNINMAGVYTVTNLIAPVNASDATTKSYVDTTTVSIAGDTMTGPLVLNANPTLPLGAATKQYVDSAVAAAVGGDLSMVYNNPIGTFTYGAGDIAISGGKIYIALTAGTSAIPGGGWKQVWPATYS